MIVEYTRFEGSPHCQCYEVARCTKDPATLLRRRAAIEIRDTIGRI